MTLGSQEDTCHRLHCLDKDREEFFDEDVLQFSKKLANLETHTNLQRSFLTFVSVKGQVQSRMMKFCQTNSWAKRYHKMRLGGTILWKDKWQGHGVTSNNNIMRRNNLVGQRSVGLR